MKEILNSSISILNTLMGIIKFIPIKLYFNYKIIIKKIVFYVIALIFLITAFVFGTIALYNTVILYLGAAWAAFALFLLSLVIGIGLILSTKFLKPKKRHIEPPSFPALEECFGQILKAQDLAKTFKKASPQALITVTVLGIAALASYVVFKKTQEK